MRVIWYKFRILQQLRISVFDEYIKCARQLMLWPASTKQYFISELKTLLHHNSVLYTSYDVSAMPAKHNAACVV